MKPTRVLALAGAITLVVSACAGQQATQRPSVAAPSVAVPATQAPSVAPATATAPTATHSAPAATPSGAAATPTSVAASPSAQAAQCDGQHINFMLSFLANIQHAGFLIAKQEGYYEDEGLDVEIVPAGPGIDVTQAVADGTADLGQIDYVPLVEARNENVPVKAVAQIYKDPFFFWYSAKDGGPATVAEWDGKRVGQIQVGQYPERDAIMLKAGIDPDSIRPVPQEFDGLLDPDKMDIAEGVVFFHPALINIIGAMGTFPDDFNVFRPAELGADFASQTVAGSESYLADNADAVACFLRASIRGWQAAFDDPQLAVDSTMAFVPEGSPITPDHQMAALPDVLEIVGTGSDDDTLLQPDPASYQSTVQQLIDVGAIDEGDIPDIADTYDASFYEAATGNTVPLPSATP